MLFEVTHQLGREWYAKGVDPSATLGNLQLFTAILQDPFSRMIPHKILVEFGWLGAMEQRTGLRAG